jgi:hypothetical protein
LYTYVYLNSPSFGYNSDVPQLIHGGLRKFTMEFYSATKGELNNVLSK